MTNNKKYSLLIFLFCNFKKYIDKAITRYEKGNKSILLYLNF